MQDFLRHLNLKNKKFKCYLNSDKSETLNLTVDIHNDLNEGANEVESSKLKDLLPSNEDEIIEFYKLHNGVKLYCHGETSGLQFYPINELKELNAEWKESFSYYEDDELYDFQKNGVAFGDISFSGNYFVFNEGKVYYSDHDGGDDEPVSESFNEFLSKIAADPAQFLYDRGCYTRYSDGKTDGQWIPKAFVADGN